MGGKEDIGDGDVVVVEYDIEVYASNEDIVGVFFFVDIEEVDKDVVSVVKMYDVDSDFKVGSKKGIREIAGNFVGFVGVVKDIDELNVLTDVGSSVEIPTGEEDISMGGVFSYIFFLIPYV